MRYVSSKKIKDTNRSVAPEDRQKLFILDNHPVVLKGLAEVLKQENGLEICGSATTIAEATRLVQVSEPDVLISDIIFPDGNALSFVERMRTERPALKVVLFTFKSDRAYLQRAMQLKVSGFVLKSSDSEAVVHALHALQQGGVYVDPALIGRAVQGRTAQFEALEYALGDVADRLSDRELATLRLVAFGYSTKEIARDLGVSPKSVETYKARASAKLGLASRASIVRYAVARGWFDGDGGGDADA